MGATFDNPVFLLVGLGVLAVNAAGLLLLLFSRPAAGGGELAALGRAGLAEALGTFAVVFVGVLSAAGGVIVGGDRGGLMQVAFAQGLALTVCLAALGRFAPGCFNPAVTLGLMVTGRLGGSAGLVALAGQLGGATAAAALLAWLFGARALGPAVPEATLAPRPAFVLEAVATAVLVLVVFGTRIDPRGPAALSPAAVGSAATVGMLALGPLTGGVLNPARYLAPALWSGRPEAWLVYLAGPVVGAVIGAVLMHFVLLGDAAEAEAVSPTEEFQQPRQAA
jgi:glycerol uptake facilitator-like aquaporin